MRGSWNKTNLYRTDNFNSTTSGQIDRSTDTRLSNEIIKYFEPTTSETGSDKWNKLNTVRQMDTTVRPSAKSYSQMNVKLSWLIHGI